jgi:arginase
MRPVTLIRAPCNLGLRPSLPGHEPGTWRAPAALAAARLEEIIQPQEIVELPRPTYNFEPQEGTRLRNGAALREFNLKLADQVARAVDAGRFAFVVGGDCSILLGALAGARKHGPVSLVHIDGHSDFHHPGNYDPDSALGAVAGMDLALATGRGEELMTCWPAIPAPLVPDKQVIQIGERESRDVDFAWPDINETDITRIDVFEVQETGLDHILSKCLTTLKRQPWPFWIHLDVDVLDQEIMPAVDCPGSPGIDPADLIILLSRLLHDRRSIGLTLTVFDPELDPEGDYALLITQIVEAALRA